MRYIDFQRQRLANKFLELAMWIAPDFYKHIIAKHVALLATEYAALLKVEKFK